MATHLLAMLIHYKEHSEHHQTHRKILKITRLEWTKMASPNSNRGSLSCPFTDFLCSCQTRDRSASTHGSAKCHRFPVMRRHSFTRLLIRSHPVLINRRFYLPLGKLSYLLLNSAEFWDVVWTGWVTRTFLAENAETPTEYIAAIACQDLVMSEEFLFFRNFSGHPHFCKKRKIHRFLQYRNNCFFAVHFSVLNLACNTGFLSQLKLTWKFWWGFEF